MVTGDPRTRVHLFLAHALALPQGLHPRPLEERPIQQINTTTMATHETEPHTRPVTPESTLTSSFYRATTTMDELTLALQNFSRLPSPSPEFPTTLVCCCGKEDCEANKAWSSLKSKLESRLILSAEVGQALLQKHEAYVRRCEEQHIKMSSSVATLDDADSQITDGSFDLRISELLKERTTLEKRLAQTILEHEIAELSTKKVSEELQDARAAVSQLTAHHARSVGLENRVQVLTQELEDMRQERDSETQKAKLAEARIADMTERLNNMQTEVRRLRKYLASMRSPQLDSFESVLQTSRERLQMPQLDERSQSLLSQSAEVTKAFETLVEGNELLKRDVVELQNLLSQSREDYHALKEELEEKRAHPPNYEVEATQSSRIPFHRRISSIQSLPRHGLKPLRIEVDVRTPSPTEPQTPPESKSGQSSSHTDFQVDKDSQQIAVPPNKPRPYKSLFLLSQSRGIQTDEPVGLAAPVPPSSPHALTSSDPRSESSSLATDSPTSSMSAIIERAVSLFNRMTQADALSLTNRLKRQHLKGADVGHLSRTTINAIVNDAMNLQIQFRVFLEDEKVPITCNRKDLRGFFKFTRDVFANMGDMRSTLNDVILNPSIAVRVREMAMYPVNTNPDKSANGLVLSAGSWITPITKLFGPPLKTADAAVSSDHLSSQLPNSRNAPRSSGRVTPKLPPKRAPKLAPALSASATIVNVEFSGTGSGRSITNTFSAAPELVTRAASATQGNSQSTSANLMGIFAGAPRVNATAEPWVKIDYPRVPPRPVNVNPLPSSVGAVIGVRPSREDGEYGFVPQRTLRRRGLSDSSIHTSFMAHTDMIRSPLHAIPSDEELPQESKDSLMQLLSRRVQNFKSGLSGLAMEISSSTSGSDSASLGTSSSPSKWISAPHRPQRSIDGDSSTPSASSQGAYQSPALVSATSKSSWAEAAKLLDPVMDAEQHIGSFKADPHSRLHVP